MLIGGLTCIGSRRKKDKEADYVITAKLKGDAANLADTKPMPINFSIYSKKINFFRKQKQAKS